MQLHLATITTIIHRNRYSSRSNTMPVGFDTFKSLGKMLFHSLGISLSDDSPYGDKRNFGLLPLLNARNNL